MLRLLSILLLVSVMEAADGRVDNGKNISNLKASINLPANETIPAVIVFGDSIVDTGNNNNLMTIFKCNFPPYGKKFPGQIPSGRFSDGKVPSDFVAEMLGIKRTVPAYLSPDLNPQDLLTGVTFASGGSGYDPLTAPLVSVLSFSDQLNYFKEYISKLKTIVGEERSNFILNKALFIVVSSSNDIAHTSLARSLHFNVPSYAEFLANSASDFIKELYGLGARRIAVFSAVPVGCVPAQRTIRGRGNCAEDLNQIAIQFNSKLAPKFDFLTKTLTNSKIVLVDVYSPLLDMIQNPKKYGFEVADKGCCGTGNVEAAVLCNQFSWTCPNASAYLFWDSYHPTESAYKVIVEKVIYKYVNKFF